MGRLYVVSTPIGHLGDVTYRAVEVLGAVSRVLAEDTRRTRTLLARYGVSARLVSLHEHNETARTERVLAWLAAGEDLALVSDAGTPLLSDPGLRLVRAVVAAGHAVVPVPGASAVLAALVASGLDPEPFTFLGFLPRGGAARAAALAAVASSPHTVVFYEAPTRLVRALEELRGACGGARAVTVARELTKRHEQFVRGTLDAALAYYENAGVRGEVVVVVEGAPAGAAEAGADEADAVACRLIAEGRTPRDVARELTRRLGLTRNDAYRIALSHAERGGEAL
jgi:16S rRNA (cytidine1402-2'-O)-methyltransferase